MSAAIEEGADNGSGVDQHRAGCGQSLSIGLVNNMPSSSRRATERQFRNLIKSAAGGIRTELSVYVPWQSNGRFEDTGARDQKWLSLHELWDHHLDAIIVTGSEPMADELTKEPNWKELAQLVDWAEDNTLSAVWSCLAAHAAVFRLDGIQRQRLPNKLFGLFECEKKPDDLLTSRLTSGLPDRFSMPHSRWNDVFDHTMTEDMAARGYRVLSKSQAAGIDAFLRKKNSLFIFYQGHPEYESDTLRLEYRRDVSRFLRGERESYPAIPFGYFDPETEDELRIFKERANVSPGGDLLAALPLTRISPKLQGSWHSVAICLYRNWLQYLLEQKEERAGIRSVEFVNAAESCAGLEQ
jgi:homoserine O-succinyltransferase